jgi:cytochrome c oxidase subunit 1
LVLLDRVWSVCYFDVLGGGDVIVFQHLFWFFGHPEVYVIILPVFGCVGFVVSVVSGIVVFGLVSLVYSVVVIVFLGFFVWVHHMFVAGVDVDSRVYFGVVTVFIGVPTCIKVVGWLFCVVFGVSVVFSGFVFVVFVGMFICGGLTGLVLANSGIDVCLHDSYFVVSHFHFVLSLGAVVGVFVSLSVFVVHWLVVEFLVFIVLVLFLVFVVSSCCVFVPLHICGLFGLPRRVSD